MTSKYRHTDLPELTRQGLYDPSYEHSACGVGLVADIQGHKSHAIIVNGLRVLINLGHRGASGADPETGDGAGLLVQMPHEFFARECAGLGMTLPEPGAYGVGAVFLPRDPEQRAACEGIVQKIVADEGQAFLGWRDVPVSPDAVGVLAARVQPVIRQFFVGRAPNSPDKLPLELRLYIIRKRISRAVAATAAANSPDFYICSLSSKLIVYKGLIMAHQLERFYHDLGDKAMVTSFVMVHSRFSTNTLGSWKLAHPYRLIIHNGEFNTLRGNVNWMTARESTLSSPRLGDEVEKLLPVVTADQSDTATFDNVLELLLASGRSLPHAMMMMIPEAWGDHIPMDQAKKDFYEFHSCLMEPWDGPALVIATDGTSVCAMLDRNGLRPCRYVVTTDDLLVMASETGVLDIPDSEVLRKWRIEPGRMLLLDTDRGRLVGDAQVKAELFNVKPYGRWLKDNKVTLDELPAPSHVHAPNIDTLLERQKAFGYTQEELTMILEPMALTGAEPVGSMGNDAPLAVLSDQNPLLFCYFRQLFAQVSNPPLDAIREELVTSIASFIGSEGNLLDETARQCHQLEIKEPILRSSDLEKVRSIRRGRLKAKTLSTLFKPAHGKGALKRAVDSLCEQASEAVRQGYPILILSDRGVDMEHAPIPSLLAVAGVHHHLIREAARTRVGLVVESGEPREVSHVALLFGYGAGAINPYLAFETLAHMVDQRSLQTDTDYGTAESNLVSALQKGVVKVMSKMGISTLQSYRGAQIYEAVGLSQAFIDQYFTWTTSRIEGVSINEIEVESVRRHSYAYLEQRSAENADLKYGGQYQWRQGGERHMWDPDSIATLQYATRANDAGAFRQFTDLVDTKTRRPSNIRGLLEFRKLGGSIPIEEVEPAREIVKRFATGATSLGSISREAHETLAVAMNRIGSRSNTGEGGEDFHRYTPDPSGDSRNSAIKQVASGRFGVTINYLASATDLQIKMAQGSKPGEGGQLPGHKVDDYIGWVRSSTPGVELISPPPHHDIYSIEDLAQLIFDLKNSNPEARIHVKLVAEAGVGTIAAGVSKGHGDVVLISGDSGGTGASPESSIKNAGLPWELGVAETQQVLVMNDLRGRIVVQTDGQLKTGRDIVIACLLGAEEFGLATAPLIVLGCIMLRKCHLNTCSVGIATQDPELRKKFAGQPEYLINYFFFLAEQVRETMAELGFRTVNEMVGRVDRLEPAGNTDHWKAKTLDLSRLLHMPQAPEGVATYHCQGQDHHLPRVLDHHLIERSRATLESATPARIEMLIGNSNRTVGTMLSHELARRYGENGLNEDAIQVSFKGSAGQSFGAFLAGGVTLRVEGDANDYFCKGLSGGKVIITPPADSRFAAEENIIVGNVALYGATAGKAYIRGIAGERFAVRNSGAESVVEGVGDHGCEYMTRGCVVVLGPTGRNFAAGMSGGEAFVLDEYGYFAGLCNTDMVDLEHVAEGGDRSTLRRLLVDHLRFTQSAIAGRILDSWPAMLPKFVKVMPRAYKQALAERARGGTMIPLRPSQHVIVIHDG